MNTYYNPVRTFQGVGVLEKLPELADRAAQPGKKILLLLWSGCMLNQSGIHALQKAEGDRLRVEVFSASNPELTQLFEMYEKTRSEEIGLVIAVGGGSVLDVGKSLCCLYGADLASPAELREMIAEKRYPTPVCRWIGVPTTAGTGSEVTCWATIWDSAANKKYSIDTKENYAFAALVDPLLAASMPLGLAVSSALDAVCHAAESYWARATGAVSRALALDAIRTVMGNIDSLLQNPNSCEAHDQMARGSMLAGLAFSNTRTTACHSISYPLTMQFRIPHGVAVSMLLGPVLELNLPAVEDAPALLRAFGVQSPEEVGKRVTSILISAGLAASLRGWGVTESDLLLLAARGITKGRADNNPVDLTEDLIYDILKKIL